jgi:phosphoadenosine phosphosulfate reductase
MRDALTSAELLIDAALRDAAAPCVTCSFQAEDVVLVDLLRRRAPRVPVLFLDTGYHFAEVYSYRDQLAREWQLNLVNLRAHQSVEEQEAERGLLYQSDPAACCHARKVEPLMRGLAPHDAWFTGLRREQSSSRAHLLPDETHAFPNGLQLRKLSPLYDWSWAEVASYLAVHEIPALPLYAAGYPSIGCEPCTNRPEPGAHERSGRWGGRQLECGLHTVSIALER